MSAIAVQVADGVAQIALDRPDARNALDYATAQELVAALERAGADPEVRVVLLRGNGRSFCAGGDLKEFERALDSDAATYHDGGVVWARMMTLIPDLPVPVIVAAHGHALAGGCALVAAADVALVAEGTTLGMSEIRIGLFPAIVYATLARAVGHRHARELALTGRRVGAAEAVRLGLAHRLVAADALLEQARALAADLATLGPDALRLGKELMQATESMDVRGGTAHGRAMRGAFMTTDDFRAGVASFLAPPRRRDQRAKERAVSETHDPAVHGAFKVIRASELSANTGQSAGALRQSGIDANLTDATKIWMGKVSNEPGYASVPHHHGEAQTSGYVLKGRARISYGESYEQHIDVDEGDFVFVPPYWPHIEANRSDEEELVWLTARTPGNIVVNLAEQE